MNCIFQKALSQLEEGVWVKFDDYITNCFFYVNNLKQAELKKEKGVWKYSSAQYTKHEVEFVRAIIFDWLYESGIVMCGKYNGDDCFKVTSFGSLEEKKGNFTRFLIVNGLVRKSYNS